jgi:RNA polymerase sigma factor (sigma-70 family)
MVSVPLFRRRGVVGPGTPPQNWVSCREPEHSYRGRGSDRPLVGARIKVADARKALLERLFAAHRGALQTFFSRRLRSQADTTDLAQEVYVRMLRVKDPEAIRDMDAYLFTVASNLAREYSARDRRRGNPVDLDDATLLNELAELPAYDSEIDVGRQITRLREVLRQLPPRWHAAIVLQYVQGLSQREIAERLGVSQRMVKKYVGQALGRCRRRMVRLG